MKIDKNKTDIIKENTCKLQVWNISLPRRV